MPQAYKNKPRKGVTVHQQRKNKPSKKTVDGWKDKSNKQLTKNIHKNSEDLIIGKAKESKIRLKIAG